MTKFVPLDGSAPCPQIPAFLSRVDEPATYIDSVVKAITKAKRIAVVCGAGISVQAGIPDFRSSDGLFQSIKRDNPKEALSSGKDLFDASVFNSEHMTALFCQMIARLATLSDDAVPTPFHNLLRVLNKKGKLLRVYTQNIDALESKAGLSLGLPRHGRVKGKSRTPAKPERTAEDQYINIEDSGPQTPSSSKLPSPPPTQKEERTSETPRCIPLHGTLQTMHCLACTHTYPLSDYVSSLSAGTLPDCPECTALETTRSMVGKRPRGIGKLRPSVVLYNEDHRDGEGVGSVVGRDLVGGKGRSGADLLLVVGTSLRVPGTKRIVREFSKAVRSRVASKSKLPTPAPTPVSSPASTPRRSPAAESDLHDGSSEDRPITAVYLNLDFPVPTREWENVFDVWLQGDAQRLAELVTEEFERMEMAKDVAVAKRKRGQEKRSESDSGKASPNVKQRNSSSAKGKKEKRQTVLTESMSVKKRRVTLIVKDPSGPSSPTSAKFKGTSSQGKSRNSSPTKRSSKACHSLVDSAKRSRKKESNDASQLRRQSSKSTKLPSPKTARPSSSPIRRRLPEVVITPRPDAELRLYKPLPTQSPRFTYYTPKSSNNSRAGFTYEPELTSPLDLLADTATALPHVNTLSTSSSSVLQTFSPRIYSPRDAKFVQPRHSYYSPPRSEGCPRCLYQCSYTCECQADLPLSPAPSSLSATSPPLPHAPAPMSLGSTRLDSTPSSVLSHSTSRFEPHVPGPPSPAPSEPALPAHVRPNLRNLLNDPDSSLSSGPSSDRGDSPSMEFPTSPTTPRASKRKRGRIVYSTPRERAKQRKAAAARRGTSDYSNASSTSECQVLSLYSPPRRDGQLQLAENFAQIDLDSDSDADLGTPSKVPRLVRC